MKFISLKEIKYEAFANFLEGYVFRVASYGTHIKCIFEKEKKTHRRLFKQVYYWNVSGVTFSLHLYIILQCLENTDTRSSRTS